MVGANVCIYAARWIAVVVFAYPPLWFAIVRIIETPSHDAPQDGEMDRQYNLAG
jgi:hypothetical protein